MYEYCIHHIYYIYKALELIFPLGTTADGFSKRRKYVHSCACVVFIRVKANAPFTFKRRLFVEIDDDGAALKSFDKYCTRIQIKLYLFKVNIKFKYTNLASYYL